MTALPASFPRWSAPRALVAEVSLLVFACVGLPMASWLVSGHRASLPPAGALMFAWLVASAGPTAAPRRTSPWAGS